MPPYHEGAAACQDWRVPCKDTPTQTTISHFRLSSLTYLPTTFPILLLCTRAPAILLNDIGHVGPQGPIPSTILCRHRKLRTLVFLSLPSYFPLHCKRKGVWSCSYSLFRSEDFWACIANPAGFWGCHPAPLEQYADVQSSIVRVCDIWC